MGSSLLIGSRALVLQGPGPAREYRTAKGRDQPRWAEVGSAEFWGEFIEKFGGRREDRTRDLRIANAAMTAHFSAFLGGFRLCRDGAGTRRPTAASRSAASASA